MDSELISIAFFVGFFGDLLLQILTKHFKMGGPTGWGLNEYFLQHGEVESLFIAGGMMALFFIIYLKVFRLPVNYLYLAIYGVILDVLFREFKIFPSLKGYYSQLNYFESTASEALSIMLPFFIYSVLKKY